MSRVQEDGVDDGPLAGGWQTTVHRVGGQVRRSASIWSPFVVDFLGHLEREGFAASPRPVGTGFDDHGNELLTFVEGHSPHPEPWSDDAIVQLGELLASLHACAQTYRPPDGAVWKDWFGRRLGTPAVGFGHGDLGPWNIMAIDGSPVGFIDWDTAGPLDPVYELAQVAWLNVQLHDDDVAERVGLGDVSQRARQLGLMLDAYGLSLTDRVGFVDKMVEFAVYDSAHEAITRAVPGRVARRLPLAQYRVGWG